MENISFVFSAVELDLVKYMRDMFLKDGELQKTHDIAEDRIIEVNGKHQVRILMTPKQLELEL